MAYDACLPWPAPVVVSRPEDGNAVRADVAWLERNHAVVYDLLGEEGMRIANIDVNGGFIENRSFAAAGRTPRIAYNPLRGQALISSEVGVTWVGRNGALQSVHTRTDPPNTSSDALRTDVFATPDGFGLLVAPTSDPGGISQGVFGRVPPTEGTIDWNVYWPDNAGPAIEHATGADGLVHRFTIEADFLVLLFEWDGGPSGPIGAPFDLGSSTTFTDGLVTDGDASLIQRSSDAVMVFLELYPNGDEIIHQLLLEDFDTSSPHVERLGTANGLRDIVVADRRIVTDTMAIARFDRSASELSAPIVLGPPGRQPRMSRTSRGLAVTWVDANSGEVLLNAVDCCIQE